MYRSEKKQFNFQLAAIKPLVLHLEEEVIKADQEIDIVKYIATNNWEKLQVSVNASHFACVLHEYCIIRLLYINY